MGRVTTIGNVASGVDSTAVRSACGRIGAPRSPPRKTWTRTDMGTSVPMA